MPARLATYNYIMHHMRDGMEPIPYQLTATNLIEYRWKCISHVGMNVCNDFRAYPDNKPISGRTDEGYSSSFWIAGSGYDAEIKAGMKLVYDKQNKLVNTVYFQL